MPIDLLMTQLSPTMTEGKIVRWLKQPGDELKSGEILAEIETDKATMELEVVDEGSLFAVLAEAGAIVPVGQAIAVIAEEGEKVAADYRPAAAPAAKTEAPTVAAATPAPAAAPVTQAASAAPAAAAVRDTSPENSKQMKSSPLARRLARQLGVTLGQVRGRGPGGRILKEDVEAAAKAGVRFGISEPAVAALSRPAAQPGPLPYHPDEYDSHEHSMMRKAIARRLVESKQLAPHFYLTLDVNMERLLDLRQQLNVAANGAFKLTVTDLIIKGAAKALMDTPQANASWTESATLRHKHAHVSLAVSLDGGLVTPVVRYAEQKSVVQISNEVRELAEKGRAGKLKPEEYSGGTFSISNLGMYGIRQFSAVINPPEGAILAVGATEARAVVENSAVVVRQMMTVTLSCDHRVVDGVAGALLLAALKKHLENPAGLLL